jgi:hypothetical protein
MLSRIFGPLAAALVLLASPAAAIPRTERGGEAVTIPFDPPLGEPLRYRWERVTQRDGETRLNWSVDDLSFEEQAEGYRLSVTPVSSGTNQTDERTQAFLKELADLTRLPFAVRIDNGGRIVELERGDEYWTRLIRALRNAFANEKFDAQQKKALEGLMSVYEGLPPDSRLAKMTESLQPVVEFAGLEFTLSEPVTTEIDSESPFGGTLKRQFVVSVTKVDKTFAYATIRSTMPSSEIERLTKGLFERMGLDLAEGKSQAEREAISAAIKQMKLETVADYKISLADGLLESFQSTETISAPVEGKSHTRVTTSSLTRVY